MTDLSQGEALLYLVDLYNKEFDKQLKNSKKGKFNYEAVKAPFADFWQVIQQRNEQADLDGFINELSHVRRNNTIEHQKQKEYLEEQFNALKIDVPEWVNNCFEEIDFRTTVIEKFLSEKQYKWKLEQITEYKEDLELELQEFTLNTLTSRTDYLKEKFNSALQEIKETESQFSEVYKYDISGFYKNHQFTTTKEDLNNLYYYAEKEKGTVTELWNIHKLLKKYFDLKNQLPVIKEVISFNFPQVAKEIKPVEENIWFQVGLTFATGKAQELYEKAKTGKGIFIKGHFTKITIELGFKVTDKVYFSQTFNNTTTDNKNIYSQPEKLFQIYTFCQKRNLEVVDDFKTQLLKYNLI